ncbi:Hypothetical predicted protein [Octopus vulgaris]|uniref:Uncharacterized protein n=1 Tax=Octopus vulgaris TaxID=6645 RepID=A0AA36B5Y6_OCTVU|nr:Hypothetical predicted protein [Octopus vulgaris]
MLSLLYRLSYEPNKTDLEYQIMNTIHFSNAAYHWSGRYNDDRMMALSKEERIPDRMMDLSKEERIELVLLSGREGWYCRKIAEEFNLRYPYSEKVKAIQLRTP